MTNLEKWDIVWAMYEAEEITEDCEGCPFAEECDKLMLYWGCGVWEDQQGEDL